LLDFWYSRYLAAPEEDTGYRPTPAALYIQLLEATEQEQVRIMPSEKKALARKV